MIAALWAKFSKWIVGVGAFVVMLASVFYAGRKSGATKAEANAANERANDREAIAVRQVNEAREASEQQVKAVQNAKDVASDNSTFDDDEVTKRMRDEWSRD